MMLTDLPRELELKILVRVPTTSSTQLKSTCKRWYSLLKQRFIEKNLSKGARQFILKKDDGVYSVSIDLENSFDPSIEFTGKLITLEDSEHVVISTIQQCDGLFLFTTKDNRLVVWNPCTGQTRWIEPSNRNCKNDRYLLGYENTYNKSFQSYKILRSSVVRNEFEIYDFNSDSWRFLDGFTHIWFIRSRGVSLKGSIYWVAWDRCKPFTSKYLLRFDFKREAFERLSLPFRSNYFDGDFSLSVVGEDKLSVFLQSVSTDSFEAKIWVTDTKIDEAKDATSIQYFLLVDFREKRSRGRMDVVSFESFLVDEDTKKVVCCGRDRNGKERIVTYILGGDQNLHVCKQIHGEIAKGQYDYYQLPQRSDDYWRYDRPYHYTDLLLSYAPSLVQIQ
ncbi:hypothetical protein N665_0072s0069 [Sinapis alba]|nr:hypothetical protein N665_0072s0069 [Sinapis alba]